MLSLGVPGLPGGPPGEEGWDWDGDDWDPAGSLTAGEIAALAALDRVNNPLDNAYDRADDWAYEPGDAAPDADGWLAAPRSALQDDGPCSPGARPVEALPGLTPRHLGADGGLRLAVWRIGFRRDQSWPDWPLISGRLG